MNQKLENNFKEKPETGSNEEHKTNAKDKTEEESGTSFLDSNSSLELVFESETSFKEEFETQKRERTNTAGHDRPTSLKKEREREIHSNTKRDISVKGHDGNLLKDGKLSTNIKTADHTIFKHDDDIIAKDKNDEHKTTKNEDDRATDEKPQTLKVYKRRWYVLLIYCMYTFTQAGFWNTFGPISVTSEKVFGWNDGTIALLSNWGPITYIIGGIPFSWMLDVKGLRVACLTSCLLTVLGAVVRCITMETPTVTVLMHVGHMLNGFGGPVAMGGPAFVSAVWFPLQERATATAIGTALNYMGVATAFLLGPGLVHSISVPHSAESADHLNRSSSPFLSELRGLGNNSQPGLNESATTEETLHNFSSTAYDAEVSRAKKEIRWYMVYVAAFSGAQLIVMLIYFPKKPPLPPAASAAIQRENFTTGLKHLLTRKMFWHVAVIYGTSLGVLVNWTSIMSVTISPLGISEKEAGWIGFYATMGGCLVSLIFARFADIFKRVMKKLVFGLYVSALVWFILFALASKRVIPSPTAIFFVVIIGGMTSLNASVPLIFELACEVSYPTGEGTTNVVLTVINNVGGLLFLFVGMIPNIGVIWMNWTLVGATAVCLPLWLLMKERYNRLAVDEINPTLDAINVEINIKAEEKTAKEKDMNVV